MNRESGVMGMYGTSELRLRSSRRATRTSFPAKPSRGTLLTTKGNQDAEDAEGRLRGGHQGGLQEEGQDLSHILVL